MKMYCLVRKDLSNSYKAVQGGHAIAEYFLSHGIPEVWNNGTMIYLGVNNEHSLLEWSKKLDVYKKQHVVFFEPDIGNEMTALAIIDDGKIFSKLSLLK